MNLARLLIAWVMRCLRLLLLALLVIIVVPPAVQYVRQAVRDFEQGAFGVNSLAQAEMSLREGFDGSMKKVEESVTKLEGKTSEKVQGRIAEIDGERKRLEKAGADAGSPLRVGLGGPRIDAEALKSKARVGLQLELLGQERAYLVQLLEFRAKPPYDPGELEQRRQTHIAVHKKLQDNFSTQKRLKEANPFLRVWHFPELLALENDETRLRKENAAADRAYKDYKAMRPGTGQQSKRAFAISPQTVEGLTKPLRDAREQLDAQLKRNWLGSIIVEAPAVIWRALPSALAIMLAAILVPIAIKAILYFWLAPIVSRRPAIALLPETSGDIDTPRDSNGSTPASVSSVSHAITIDGANELLVHSEYLQSTPHGSVNDTKLFLSRSHALSSIAAGLYAVTRMRSAAPARVVLSATRDPLSEVGALFIPAGSAIVLQPRHLVGMLQPRDRPMLISSHWRLGSLHAWLTLQLRYLVFHGPGTLVVKGCRGVRVESAEGGRSISQAATVGFSANLGYSSRRSETFVGYLSGKLPLLHDSFSGASGYYVYQEVPFTGGIPGGVTGKGLEGVTDAFLKALGI